MCALVFHLMLSYLDCILLSLFHHRTKWHNLAHYHYHSSLTESHTDFVTCVRYLYIASCYTVNRPILPYELPFGSLYQIEQPERCTDKTSCGQ